MARISKSLRYQVLRRDGFRCTYCGATPREAELEVDHVKAESLGGKTEAENLTTSCKPCNRGKAATPADAEKVAQVDADARRWTDAMKRATEIQEKGAEADRELVAWFGRTWDRRASEHELTADMERGWGKSVLTMRKAGASCDMLDQAVSTAMRKRMADGGRWRYFCGIVWGQLRDRMDIARSLLGESSPVTDAEARQGKPPQNETAAWFEKVRGELLSDAADLYASHISFWLVDLGDGTSVVHAQAAECLSTPLVLGAFLMDELHGIDAEEAFGSELHDPAESGTRVHFCSECCSAEAAAYNKAEAGEA